MCWIIYKKELDFFGFLCYILCNIHQCQTLVDTKGVKTMVEGITQKVCTKYFSKLQNIFGKNIFITHYSTSTLNTRIKSAFDGLDLKEEE